MNNLSASASIRFGWELFKKRPWFFVGVTLIYLVLTGIVRSITSYDNPQGLVALVAFIVNLALTTLLSMGMTYFTLEAHDNPESVTLSDLWHPQHFWSFFVAQILVFVCVMIGFVLLIIPGIILALMFWFTGYLIIDQRLGAIDAMKESVRMTKGYRWELFVLALIAVVLNVLGAVLLVAGLLVTIPVTMLAMVHAYRTLKTSPVPAAAATSTSTTL